MVDEKVVSREQRRGSPEKAESKVGHTPTDGHEHKFTSTIKNVKDLPFRQVCESCGHSEPIPPEAPVRS